jgi:hypothetical protein
VDKACTCIKGHSHKHLLRRIRLKILNELKLDPSAVGPPHKDSAPIGHMPDHKGNLFPDTCEAKNDYFGRCTCDNVADAEKHINFLNEVRPKCPIQHTMEMQTLPSMPDHKTWHYNKFFNCKARDSQLKLCSCPYDSRMRSDHLAYLYWLRSNYPPKQAPGTTGQRPSFLPHEAPPAPHADTSPHPHASFPAHIRNHNYSWCDASKNKHMLCNCPLGTVTRNNHWFYLYGSDILPIEFFHLSKRNNAFKDKLRSPDILTCEAYQRNHEYCICPLGQHDNKTPRMVDGYGPHLVTKPTEAEHNEMISSDIPIAELSCTASEKNGKICICPFGLHCPYGIKCLTVQCKQESKHVKVLPESLRDAYNIFARSHQIGRASCRERV